MVTAGTARGNGGSPAATASSGSPAATAGSGPEPAGPGAGADLSTLRDIADQLMDRMPRTVRRVALRVGELAVEVEWAEPAAVAPLPSMTVTAAGPQAGLAVQAVALRADLPQAGSLPPGTEAVRTPLVGTFYRAPEPGADPFVRPGDQIEAGAVIGIVEAMKMMNTITAHCAGTVVAVLPADGQPVEFDQELILISREADDAG